MNSALKLLVFILTVSSCSQNNTSHKLNEGVFRSDSLLIVNSNDEKGFYSSYILFVPEGTPKNKLIYLLVEPNNTGTVSDSLGIHKKSAIELASVNSVGNNISTNLKIPLLVPIFPRPASKPLVYSHALDRDVMLEKEPILMRLDLQLISMVKDAKEKLHKLEIQTKDKFFLNGFSASGTFTNRFLFMHPKIIKAAASGGINGELMLPLKMYDNQELNYPLGINDLQNITDIHFDEKAYKKVPQFIYMGALDNNDAVQFDDAYSLEDRDIINSKLGKDVPGRWEKCQHIYIEENVAAQFRTYPNVGHGTTSEVNLDVTKFFLKYLGE